MLVDGLRRRLHDVDVLSTDALEDLQIGAGSDRLRRPCRTPDAMPRDPTCTLISPSE